MNNNSWYSFQCEFMATRNTPIDLVLNENVIVGHSNV